MQKKSLCGMMPDDIHGVVASGGYGLSHALTIAKGFYRKRIYNFSQLPDIQKGLKTLIEENCTPGLLHPDTFQESSDGSVKYLFRTDEGKAFETVFLPDKKRNSVCVSTQSGCRMGCPFCVTASYGFHGNLSAGEIINQIISLPQSSKIDHVVFMGMGEPMDNIEEVLKACTIITSQWGLAISQANVTVSTVGIAPAIRSFLDRSGCNLTVSLYSPFEEERIKAVPAEKKYPVRDIIEMLKNYPLKKKRRVSMAYMMINGINDTDRHLEELRRLFAGSAVRINLLPYHPGHDDTRISSPDDRIQYFRHSLVMAGVSASVRRSRGSDISAACGLLASGLRKN